MVRVPRPSHGAVPGEGLYAGQGGPPYQDHTVQKQRPPFLRQGRAPCCILNPFQAMSLKKNEENYEQFLGSVFWAVFNVCYMYNVYIYSYNC